MNNERCVWERVETFLCDEQYLGNPATLHNLVLSLNPWTPREWTSGL